MPQPTAITLLLLLAVGTIWLFKLVFYNETPFPRPILVTGLVMSLLVATLEGVTIGFGNLFRPDMAEYDYVTTLLALLDAIIFGCAIGDSLVRPSRDRVKLVA